MSLMDVDRRTALGISIGLGLSLTKLGEAAMPGVTPSIQLALDLSEYEPGDLMTLTITENLSAKHTFAVSDPATSWSLVAKSETETTIQYRALAPEDDSIVTVRMTRTWDKRSVAAAIGYVVDLPAPVLIPGQQVLHVEGMSSPADVWDTRVAQVVEGSATRRKKLTARRIFANLSSSGRDQSNLIEKALAEGYLPVVSYKGTNQSYAEATGDYLESLNQPIWALSYHEPEHQGLTPDQFEAIQLAVIPHFQRPNVACGMLNNGWLLDRRVLDFFDYMRSSMMDSGMYRWVGMDTYQAGNNTLGSLTEPWPADRLTPFADGMEQRGWGGYPLVVGEWNGFHGDVIADFHARILADPRFVASLMFNSTILKGFTLTHDSASGDRLGRFQAMLDDARVYSD